MGPSEDLIFHEALAKESPEACEAYLEQKCAGLPDLLKSVRSLLAAYPRGEFLEDTLPEVSLARSVAMCDLQNTRLGPYHIRELIGHGGMGNVYLAEQLQPVHRKVAIKFMHAGMNSLVMMRRFQQEQRTLAMMDHPNIARVVDAAVTTSGRSYFVMELVNGISILRYSERQGLDVQQRLHLFIDCCHAIHHAHQKGIIHRDIKPSNVLVAMSEGIPVVKVIDFGIAKALALHTAEAISTQHSFATQLGEMLGTPLYMSPEQASMGETSVDTRTDIYSLGAMLYALMTGVSPCDSDRFRQAGFDEVRRIVREDYPQRPSVKVLKRASLPTISGEEAATCRRLAKTLTGDLDCIIMKAIEKDRDRRYQTVNELVHDLKCYFSNDPIVARVPTLLYTLSKFARRRCSVLISIVIAATCLLFGLAIAIVQASRANRAEQVALNGKDRAENAENQMERLLYVADLRVASLATLNGNSAEANEALQRQMPQPGREDLRSFDWHFLQGLNKAETRELLKTEKPLYHLCRITGSSQLACCGQEGVISIVDDTTGKLLHSINAEQGEVNGLASSPDGKILASAGDDGTIALWDAATGRAKSRFKAHQRQAFQVAWSPDGNQLATCGNEPNARIWSAADFSAVCVFPTARDLECLAANNQGDLAFGAEGGVVTLTRFPAEAGKVPATQTSSDGRGEHCGALAFSPDGRFLATGRLNGRVLVMATNATTLGVTNEFLLADAVTSLAFSHDGRRLAASLRSGGISTLELSHGLNRGIELTIRDSLTDTAGNRLDGDGDGIGGGPWRSLSPSSLAANGDSSSLQLLRIDPPFVDGYLPNDARTVVLEFSNPILDAHTADYYELYANDYAIPFSDDRDRITPAAITVNGCIVTLKLPDEKVALPEIAENKSERRVPSRNRHEGAAAFVCASLSGNEFFSVGNDGRLIAASDASKSAVHLIGTTVPGFDYYRDGSLRVPTNQLDRVDGSFSICLPDNGRTINPAARLLHPQIAISTGATFGFSLYGQPEHMAVMRWSPDFTTSSLAFQPKPGEPMVFGFFAVSPDEQVLVTFVDKHTVETNPGPYEMLLWSLKEGCEIARQPCTGCFDVRFSHNGRTMAAISNDALVVRDAGSGRVLHAIHHPAIRGFDFSPDDLELATVSNDGMLRTWRVADGIELHSVHAHNVSANGVAYTSDGKTIGTVGSDGLFRCWCREILQQTMEVPFRARLYFLKFSPDGTSAAVQDGSGRLFLLSTEPTANQGL